MCSEPEFGSVHALWTNLNVTLILRRPDERTTSLAGRQKPGRPVDLKVVGSVTLNGCTTANQTVSYSDDHRHPRRASIADSLATAGACKWPNYLPPSVTGTCSTIRSTTRRTCFIGADATSTLGNRKFRVKWNGETISIHCEWYRQLHFDVTMRYRYRYDTIRQTTFTPVKNLTYGSLMHRTEPE